jgi:hypothetical protein
MVQAHHSLITDLKIEFCYAALLSSLDEFPKVMRLGALHR